MERPSANDHGLTVAADVPTTTYNIPFSYKILLTNNGVAGPLAAWGGGRICRPFVLGFGNWRACLKYKSHVMSTATLVY